MRKKNLFLAMLAMVLVCAISVTGTLAYLTATANNGTVVKNTFLASGGGELIIDPDGDETEYEGPVFTLLESKAEDTDADGIYTLASGLTETTNTYNVLPGVDLPKNPTITVNKKTDAPGYLYVEVVNKEALEAYGLTFDMDTCWLKLDGVEGKAENGDVYVYTGTGATALALTSTNFTGTEVNVIKDKTVKVADDIEKVKSMGTDTAAAPTLKFYAYMAQSTVTVNGTATSEAAAVYTTCFGD